MKRLLAVVVSLAVLTAACGDDDDAEEVGETSVTTATESSDPAAPESTEDADTTEGTTAPEATAPPETLPEGVFNPDDVDTEAVMRVASTVGNRTYDPHRPTTCSGEFWTLSMVYARLINLTPAYELEPMLATSWEFTEDGSALVMELRDDVSFRDGSPFNAEVVKANIERAKTLETSTMAPDVSSVESVEVVDDYTVQFNLVDGEGMQLPWFLAQCVGMISNPNSWDAEGFDQVGDGLGPYVVEPGSFQVAVSSAMVRDGEWWGDPALGAHFARIEAQSVDNDAGLNLVQTGALDYFNTAGEYNLQAQAIADADPNLEYYPFDTFLSVGIAMNLESATVSNQLLRQAMNYALDREGIAQAAFRGECTVSVQPALPGFDGYDPALNETQVYDPDRARELVAESGYDGSPITLIHHSVVSYAPANEAAQALFQEVGINVQLTEPLASAEAIPRFLEGDGDAFGFPLGASLYPTQAIKDSVTGRYTRGITTDEIGAAAVGLLDPALSDEERADVALATNQAVVEGSTIIPICTIKKGIIANAMFQNADQTSSVRLGTQDMGYVYKRTS